jgi:hypothetical protein
VTARPEDQFWMNHIADQFENAKARDGWEYIQSLNDKDLREFVGEICLAMGQNTAFLAQEILRLEGEIEAMGGSK